MKKCNECNTQFVDSLTFCPECGSKNVTTADEMPVAESVAEEATETAEVQPETAEETAAEQPEAEEKAETADETEQPEEEEPVPVVGLIIAGIVALAVLAVGIYFKLKA